jgi:Ca-activated chloride channel homolog
MRKWTSITPIARNALTGSKVVRFALWGALGCIAGAILGELWLQLIGAGGPRNAICLLIDCSGSMSIPDAPGEPFGKKLREVKQAAGQFIKQQDLSIERVAVIGFGSGVHPTARLGSDEATLIEAVSGLEDGGNTAMDRALDAAAQSLDDPSHAGGADINRDILLFTDGEPDDSASTLNVAERCHAADIHIIAIGTGDANMQYLAQLTGDAKLVFRASAGNFAEGFEKANKAIHGSLVETSGVSSSWIIGFVRIAVWTSCLAIGIALALVVGQNLYLHRAPIGANDAAMGVGGGLAAGMIAGSVGQLLYIVLARIHIPAIGQIIGWSILGALIGRGLALFVPNLEPKKSATAGAVGGAIGAVVFLILSHLAPIAGRFLGATTLGAFIGAMIALVEVAYRRAWLEVRYGTKEVITVSLGDAPVRIGSDRRAATIYARSARPLACQYALDNSQVIFSDFALETKAVVKPGDQRDVGNVTVTVRASNETLAESAPKTTGAIPMAPPPPKKAPSPASASPAVAPPPGAARPAPSKSPTVDSPSTTKGSPSVTPRSRSVLPPPPPPRNTRPGPPSQT